jgi:hypothetical protein
LRRHAGFRSSRRRRALRRHRRGLLLDEGFTDADADGYAACGGDCDDSNPSVHPGAGEICNGVDDNCDASPDNADLDQDGFSACSNDCNDLNGAIHPGASDVCNGLDDDCDGLVDEGSTDVDGDGYAACVDCNDSQAAVHPGAPEICNRLGDNCNLFADEGFPDLDNDTYPACFGDCDDLNSQVWFPPFEVSGLVIFPNQPTFLSWNTQGSAAGPETVFDLVSGQFGPVTGINLGAGSCLAPGLGGSANDLRADPASGIAYWYLVRGRNSCGNGSYGTNTLGQERNPPPCP